MTLVKTFCALLALGAGPLLRADDLPPLVINEYFGMTYKQEPVSFDLSFPKARPAHSAAIEGGPAQLEIVEGTADAATKVRLWTLVDFAAPGQKVLHATIDATAKDPNACSVADAGEVSGVKIAIVSNGLFSAKIPVGSATFPTGKSDFEIPGPVVSVSADGKTWYGSGYLDSMLRVKAVKAELNVGPVFFQSTITYTFENDRQYVARARVYPSKPYVQLVEDFNVGGASRFVFNYDNWTPERFLTCADGKPVHNPRINGESAGDFITEEGQRCLVRMCIWTQFGYFHGKSETIGLCPEDCSIGVGGFYIRPDRWTRPKLNHVDLYARPEVAGDRMTRGVVGLAGSKERYALEAWIIDGHREWAIFAMPVGKWTAPPGTPDANGKPTDGKFEWNVALRKAHVVEGVWPLDRLNRLPLVWNPDGSPISVADTAPDGATGNVDVVLKAFSGRVGLQTFNGSEGSMRGSKLGYLAWAKQHLGGKAADLRRAATQPAGAPPKGGKAPAAPARTSVSENLAGPAMWTYMAMDESAYPGRRAMLPWTDPEALNPFYQGMENMNFNADRYRCVSEMGAGMALMKQPDGDRMLHHGEEQMSLALDRYVYPDSGCWEESHGYCAHTMRNLIPLAKTLRECGLPSTFDDLRFAHMFQFWCVAHSPRDPGFDNLRLPAAIGDHGTGGPGEFIDAFRTALPEFAASKDPAIQQIARQMLWLLGEKGGLVDPPADPAAKKPAGLPPLPAGLKPEKPDLKSRYLQGYGVTMRATDDKQRESYVVLRAEQSWGHHHQDKGSLWGWFRNVHFFGDAAWGGPPGSTYGNSYKQGPASGTQIEFRGINNWTLPCKYPAPWISDDQYTDTFSYANARCMFPFNPRLDLSQSSPAATRNGYDRQVLMVHPDLLIVRDNVESAVPTIWRMHSSQPDGTKVDGARVTMTSPQKVIGELNMLYPKGVTFSATDKKDLLDGDKEGVGDPFGSAPGAEPKGGHGGGKYDTRTIAIRWDMPANTSASWTFAVHDDGQAAPKSLMLDEAGRVTKTTLADGREVTVLMNIEPFKYSGEGITFEGTVGLVIRSGGKATVYPIRATVLTAN